MNTVPQVKTNIREDTIRNILGRTFSTLSSYASGPSGEIGTTGTSPSFFLSILFYFFLYSFILLLILIIIHYSVRPIFRFTPGSKGVIGVPGMSDDKLYWNTKKLIPADASAPAPEDSIANYPFDTNFSFSVDVLIQNLPETDLNNRVVLYLASDWLSALNTLRPTTVAGNNQNCKTTQLNDPPFKQPSSTPSNIKSFMKANGASMLVYLDKANNLNISFFHANNDEYSTRPIRNVPLYSPFRLTVVVEKRLVNVYLNGKQASQLPLPSSFIGQKIQVNSVNINNSKRFFTAPSWMNTPRKTIYVQNLHLWPRAINYEEVRDQLPALASKDDFGVPQ